MSFGERFVDEQQCNEAEDNCVLKMFLRLKNLGGDLQSLTSLVAKHRKVFSAISMICNISVTYQYQPVKWPFFYF